MRKSREYERRHRLVVRFLILACIPVILLCHAQSPEQARLEKLVVYPTVIAFNGKIATMDRNLTFHEAMAIRGDRIWMLGTDQEIKELAGPATQMIDLKGRTVVPGLIDAHTHPQLWGTWRLGGQVLPQLAPAYAHGKDLEEVMVNLRKVVQQRIQTQGKDQWVIASIPHRFNQEVPRYPQQPLVNFNFTPRGRIERSALDIIAPDTPVVLISGCCQSIANRKARELMVQKLGYEPAGSVRILYDLVWGIILAGKTSEATEILTGEMQNFVDHGVTTVATHSENNTEVFNVLNRLDREGKMPVRFAWSHESGFYGSKDPVEYYRLLGNFLGQGSDYLWNVGVGWEAWDSTSAANCVSPIAKTDELQNKLFGGGDYPTCIPSDSIEFRAHLAAIEAGLRLYDVHNRPGDKVLDRAFALAEQAIKDKARTLEDIRQQGWEFDHSPLIRPNQIPLIKKYGFNLDFQGSGLALSLYNASKYYKPGMASWITPLKSLLDAGIPFALGTDVGLSKLDDDGENFLNSLSAAFPYRDSIWPWIGVWVQQVTEVAMGEFGTKERNTTNVVLGREQRIDRVSALRGMTTWAADFLLRGDRLGSLEPGKLADAVVIDKDYFTIPEPELMTIKTIMTIFGGKIVYKASDF